MEKSLEKIAWVKNRNRWENKEGKEVFPVPLVEAVHFKQYSIITGDDSNYRLIKERLSTLKQIGVITSEQEDLVNAYSFGRHTPQGGENVFVTNFYKI